MTTADFIQQYQDGDVRQLAFLASKYPEVDMPYALDQIRGRQTARHKLPTWAAIDGIIYPPHLSMEQCSSEATAEYKSLTPLPLSRERGVVCIKGHHINNEETQDSQPSTPLSLESGKGVRLFVDLTGGFGVDFSYMARRLGGRAIYVERQEHLCEVARHNFALLGLDNAEVICGDGVEVLHQLDHADVIYLDPARRDGAGNKVVSLADCTPDVTQIVDLLLEKADKVMIKLSPMLDWHKAVADLRCVREVHIVSVGNECKELLLVLSAQEKGPSPRLFCVNDEQVVEVFKEERGNLKEERGERREERDMLWRSKEPATQSKVGGDVSPRRAQANDASKTSISLSSHNQDQHITPLSLERGEGVRLLFSPNASLMKAGCFSWIASHYGLRQLAPNSHLFVGEQPIPDFPGRSFEIKAVCSLNKKELKRHLQGITHANIATRNFPLSVAELRKRLKLKDGGNTYIFATTLDDGSHVLIIATPHTTTA